MKVLSGWGGREKDGREIGIEEKGWDGREGKDGMGLKGERWGGRDGTG